LAAEAVSSAASRSPTRATGSSPSCALADLVEGTVDLLAHQRQELGVPLAAVGSGLREVSRAPAGGPVRAGPSG
jgi:hypothetical protein